MFITVADTHAYAGCRVVLRPELGPEAPDAMFEFSDGAVASGRAEANGASRWAITIGTYTTGRGCAIAEKSWIIRPGKDGLVIARPSGTV